MSMLDLQVREVALERCFELTALSDEGVAQLKSEWAGAQQVALHFAPGRWLLPEPSVALIRAFEASPAATLVDVDGKYRRILIGGGGAGPALRSTIALDSVLGGRRDCAAVTLFDCPTILARSVSPGTEGYEVWVHASYLASFTAALDAARRRIRLRPQEQ